MRNISIRNQFIYPQINSFTNFPGMKSNIGNKPKQLKSVLYKLIDQTFLASFTWTGKVPKGQKRKHALKDYPNTLRVLRFILEKLEGSYNEEMFLNHLKNKVIKHAYG